MDFLIGLLGAIGAAACGLFILWLKSPKKVDPPKPPPYV